MQIMRREPLERNADESMKEESFRKDVKKGDLDKD